MLHCKPQRLAENLNFQSKKGAFHLVLSCDRRARLVVQQEKLAKAISRYQQALMYNPKHLIAHQEREDIFLKLQQWHQAIFCYHQA